MQTEPVFERIVENGNHLLDETEPGAEKEALQQRIDDTKKKWEEVKDKSYKRKDDIDKLYPLAQAYNDDYVTFSVYLQDAEKRKDNLKPVSADEEEILKQLEDIKVCFYLTNVFLLTNVFYLCYVLFLYTFSPCIKQTKLSHQS